MVVEHYDCAIGHVLSVQAGQVLAQRRFRETGQFPVERRADYAGATGYWEFGRLSESQQEINEVRRLKDPPGGCQMQRLLAGALPLVWCQPP